MNAKALIQLNNKKRKVLIKENEEYYDKMLVYIRTSIVISEQQSEELLMELLDHIIHAQHEGKSAEDVFGNNPSAYCDEMIKQLPKESWKSGAFFIGFLLLKLAALIAIINGIGSIITLYFKDSNQTVYIGTVFVTFLITCVIIFLFVFLTFKWLQQSVYKVSNKVRDFLFIFFMAAITLLSMIFLARMVPPFGYAIEAGGYVYLILGLATMIITKWLNGKYQLTK
ncbi:DUF1129 family protein [Longirhabdus pacifica]|uniref:DUF1129 family protein n=1 Tax=Longirhabdus pacifica TaxID=2305227 RepID=UPI00100884B4|nr:DUF1129 family protein [Longirhabdus pacifica]